VASYYLSADIKYQQNTFRVNLIENKIKELSSKEKYNLNHHYCDALDD